MGTTTQVPVLVGGFVPGAAGRPRPISGLPARTWAEEAGPGDPSCPRGSGLGRGDIGPDGDWLGGLLSSESPLFLVIGLRGTCKGTSRPRPVRPDRWGLVARPPAVGPLGPPGQSVAPGAHPHPSSPSTPPGAFHTPGAHSLATYCTQQQRATCLGLTWPAGGCELPARARGGPQTSRPGGRRMAGMEGL